MDAKLIKLKILGDERGSLISLEQNKNIPFQIKRVYFIYGTKPNFVRGKHAHTNLKQVAICTSGSCTFLLDDGKRKKEIHLNRPEQALYIGKNIWREMSSFSKDCVIMVLANKHYDEDEYIRNYDMFLKKVNK